MSKKNPKKNFTIARKNLNLGLDSDIPSAYRQALELEEASSESELILRQKVEEVRQDENLSLTQQEQLLERLLERYAYLFSQKTLSSDYATLKNEIKFLSGVSAYAYVLLAQRLKKIRDERLFIQDGYKHFKEFVEEELPLSRNTVYKYIEILEVFPVTTLLQEGLQVSKLIPAIPLARRRPELRGELVEFAIENTARAVEGKVRTYMTRSKTGPPLARKTDKISRTLLIRAIWDYIERNPLQREACEAMIRLVDDF